ncbi:MAG: sensor histidine kinase [Bacteroidales bacterium]
MNIQNSNKIIESYINDKASIVIIYLNKECKIISYNKYCSEIIDNEKLTGFFYEIVVDFHSKFNLDELKKLIKTGTRQLLTINARNDSPISLYFEFFETVEGYIAIGEHNINELERKNIDFLHLSNELNNLSRELIKKNIELIKLNDLKNQFLGMAAHDIRNPASLISGYCSLFANRNISEEKKQQFIEIIKTSGDTILKLINDLLDVSIIESGKLKLYKIETDFNLLIYKNIEQNRYFSAQKSINIELTSSENDLVVSLDPEKINQVLNNYITNAIKYSETNTTIRVNVAKQNNELIVSVKDEGVGIQKDDLSKLYQFFSKTDSRTTAGESSTGLGLAIVKKIITEHSGRVWAESEQGKGSTFYFSLPIKEDKR